MMDTVSEDVKRRAPRHDLASRAQTAVGREAALSSDLRWVCVTVGGSPANRATTLASR
jgi:hypothetical protein